MAFMGETNEVGIADLLSVLARRGHTGRLTISAGCDDTQIYLDDGRISLVSSSRRELRLGRMLVRLGAIDDVKLGAAVREQDQDGEGRALGQILTESGRITTNDLEHAAEEQCIEALARVIVEPKGSFTFNRNQRPAFRDGLLALNAEGIVLEASRRADEMIRLRGMLPPAAAKLGLTPKASLAQLTLGAAEQLIVDAIRDLPLTLGDLAEALPIEEVALWRAIVRLRERGLIYAVGQKANAGPAEPPEAKSRERSIPEVLQLGASGPLSVTNPIPTVEEMRAAEPARGETVIALIRLLQEVLDDQNERRLLRAMSNHTDDFIRRAGMVIAANIEALRHEGPPLPEEARERLVDVRDARLLPDGRVSAIVITCRPNEPDRRVIMLFAPYGRGWRIDADLG